MLMTAISYCVGFRIRLIKTAELSGSARKALRELVRSKCPDATEELVQAKIDSYQDVILAWSFGKLKGAMFVVYFEEEGDNHLYLGPTFFRSRPALGLVFMVLIDVLSKGVRTLHVFSEIQNPEILMHMHITVDEESFSPRRRTFFIPEKDRELVGRFIANVPQLDPVDIDAFRSWAPGAKSFFPRKEDQKPVVGWLKHNGINLARGDSLLILCHIDRKERNNIGKRIYRYWREYPKPRLDYLDELRSYSQECATE